MTAHDSLSPQFEVTPLKKSDLGDAPGAATSRKVSPEEYQTMAGQGRQYLDKLSGQHRRGLDRKMPDIQQHAYEATREPWGGATYNAKTGKAMSTGANSYALTSRLPGQEQVSVKPDANPEQFGAAMGKAREQLNGNPATHLGVFHDADKGTVDIDPVVVTKRRADAENVGAYTRASGGAYHFRSGKGFYPPHVD